MAKKQTKGSLDDRIAKENAREKSRNAAPKAPGGGSLPAGIENGIAKLTQVDFNVIEKGKYEGSQRFYCHGTCVEPEEHEGVKCAGRLVQPGMITLDDVNNDFGETSFEENVAKAENRLKLLGFPTEDFEKMERDTLKYFNSVGPMYFRFRTWKPDDGDRVIIMIEGPAKYDKPVKDDVEEEPEPTAKTKTVEAPEEEEPKADVDLTSLGEVADEGDERAQLQIVSAAKKVGINAEDPQYKNWKDVVEAVLVAQGGGSVESGPAVGDVFSYRPPRAKEDKDCEVVGINLENQTVSLKCLSDDAEYSEVEWGKLMEIA